MVARRYGRLFADLRRAGTPIPINDIWIAATTLDCGGHLLTFDGDFKVIASRYVQPEALAAWALFQTAAETEQVDRALLGRIAARLDPGGFFSRKNGWN
jgi:hypothetical protein